MKFIKVNRKLNKNLHLQKKIKEILKNGKKAMYDEELNKLNFTSKISEFKKQLS
jgi:hypothetical protein